MNSITTPQPSYDAHVVGAGPVGCVCAERLASQLGWNVLVIERRPGVGGMCMDFLHPSGVFVHAFGPHYFRTSNPSLLAYLSRFTDWIAGRYIVRAFHNGALYPIPINLDTLERFFARTFTPAEARAFLEARRKPIDDPANSEEFVLSRVGRELYEAFYKGYTEKQWGRGPRDLDPGVCGRVPIRFDYRNTYVDDLFQVMPKEGYTKLFTTMLTHDRIDVWCGIDYLSIREELAPPRATIYTGQVDDYFGRNEGPLAYRSLRFEFDEFQTEYRQPCVQINFPNDHAYTRTLEYKHITGQACPNTIVAREYPTVEGDPFYPVPSPEQHAAHARYAARAEVETRQKKVFFRGRLAQYRYLNMDQAMEIAWACAEQIKERMGAK